MATVGCWFIIRVYRCVYFSIYMYLRLKSPLLLSQISLFTFFSDMAFFRTRVRSRMLSTMPLTMAIFAGSRIFPYEDWLQVLSRQGRYREQAWTILQDLGLNILLYEKQTRLINSKY